MSDTTLYKVFPLGDQAITFDFGNVISEAVNARVTSLFHRLAEKNLPGIEDIVPAYSSITIFYDPAQFDAGPVAVFEQVQRMVEAVLLQPSRHVEGDGNLVRIPVCYAPCHAPDLEQMARAKGLEPEEVIDLHTAVEYRVYMIGFLPGFPYMGKVDDRIAFPRHAQPRLRVQAGAVGIAGSQTGIYSLDSPGGWQIIGRTPLSLFDREKDQPVLLQPGDRVAFYSISEDEFTHYKSRPA